MKSLIGLVLLITISGCTQNNVFELALGDCFDVAHPHGSVLGQRRP